MEENLYSSKKFISSVASSFVGRITPEIASAILENCNTANRKITKSSVVSHAKKMSEGKWLFNGESIAFDKNGVLQDGQHRLHAIIQSNTTQDFVIAVGCEPMAFETYDTGKNRSASDVVSIEGVFSGSEATWATRIAKACHYIESLCPAEHGSSSTRVTAMTNGECNDYVKTHANEIRSSMEIIKSVTKVGKNAYKQLNRRSYLDGMIMYLIKNHETLDNILSFFNTLCGSHYGNSNATEMLRNNYDNRCAGKHMTDTEYWNVLCLTWNEFKDKTPRTNFWRNTAYQCSALLPKI